MSNETDTLARMGQAVQDANTVLLDWYWNEWMPAVRATTSRIGAMMDELRESNPELYAMIVSASQNTTPPPRRKPVRRTCRRSRRR